MIPNWGHSDVVLLPRERGRPGQRLIRGVIGGVISLLLLSVVAHAFGRVIAEQFLNGIRIIQ